MSYFVLFYISEEQIDIRKSEIVCQQISEQKLCGPYVVLIAHSHREYRLIILRKSFFVHYFIKTFDSSMYYPQKLEPSGLKSQLLKLPFLA